MLRLRSPARRLAAALGTVIATGLFAPAYAETIDLTCDASPANQGNVTYLSFDTDAGTAVVWGNGSTRDTQPKIRAAFSDQKVTWRFTMATGYQGGLVQDFSFDRGTGALNVSSWSNGRTNTSSWTCKRAARVF